MAPVSGATTTLHHFLELTIISAQDIYPANRSMQTYAAAWVQPSAPLFTHIDPSGHTNPSWNDKFVFKVDDTFIRSNTALVTVHLYAVRSSMITPFTTPDLLIGTVGIVISSLRPSPGTRQFAALQVRRPTSLQPHGILNVSVALVENVRSENAALSSYDIYSSVKFGRCASRVSMDSMGEKEREELDLKLEMWKAELLPMNTNGSSKSEKMMKKRRSRSLSFSCFSCGGDWD